MNNSNSKAQTSSTIRRIGRPFSVTLLGLGVLLIAGLNIIRLSQAVEQWNFLAGLTGISPLYIALSGLFWFLVGLPLGWGLLIGKRWAPNIIRLFALLYSLYFWIDTLLVAGGAQNPSRMPAWPFDLGMNLFLIVFTFIVLARPAAKAFFGVNHGE